MKIQIKQLHPGIHLPQYATALAGALDLQAAIPEPVRLYPGDPAVLIPTGIAVYMGTGDMVAMILPRSGLGHKVGLVLGNTVGLIDGDYQGQLFISAWNRSTAPILISPLERIAQLVFVPIIRADFELVTEFSDTTARGDKGYGSTGV